MKKIFIIEGMTCGHCVNTINRALSSLPGIKSYNTTLESKSSEVEYDENKLTDQDVKSAIEEWGYRVVEVR